MRLLRPILICLTLAGVLAALVAVAAFVPAVQTWVVRRALSGRPGVDVSVESVSAGPSNVHVVNLRLQKAGGVFTVPVLDATLPVTRALWDRQLRVGTLVAKGWTLDLSREPTASEAEARPAGGAPSRDKGGKVVTPPGGDVVARKVVSEFRGLLAGWAFPGDTSLDGVNLEGDVLLASFSGKGPTRLHVTIVGGGMANGRVGEFSLDASGPVSDSPKVREAVAIHGRLAVAMASPQSVNRVEFEGRASAADGSLPEDLRVGARVVAADGANGEAYRFSLNRGSRRLVGIAADLSDDGRRYRGKWQLDLDDSDLVQLQGSKIASVVAVTGDGRLDGDSDFSNVQATGQVKSTVGRFGGSLVALRETRVVALQTDFDLVHTGRVLQIDRLDLSLTGPGQIAAGHLVQPVLVDERTGALAAKDPGGDWLQGSLTGFPMAWLSGIVEGVGFAGGEVTGEFGARGGPDGVVVRSNAPLLAKAVTVLNAGGRRWPALGLALSLSAEHMSRGWQVKAAPLTVDVAGGHVATIEATVTPPTEAPGPSTITGKWNVDLEKLGALPEFAEIGPMSGRSTFGTFTATLGSTKDVRATVNLVGTAPAHSVTGNTRVIVSATGRVTVQIPLTITVGANKTGITAVGHWTKEPTGTLVEMDLSGVDVATEHLSLLGPWWSAIIGVISPERSSGGGSESTQVVTVRDQRAFWGDWIGRVTFSCYHLRSGEQELNEVAGTLSLERGSIRLMGGRALLAPAPSAADRGPYPSTRADAARNRVTAEGSISFDPGVGVPYRISATAAVDMIDSARLFTPAQVERGPVVEGRFSMTDRITGQGLNLQNLLDQKRDEFRLAGKGGIIRLLKTNIAESIPVAETPKTDALTKVGSLVGALFGVKKEYIDSGMNHLSKPTEAVLDFSYQTPEIRYDELSFTAIRGADQAIHLSDIVVSAPNVRLTGTGQVGHVQGLPLRAQPLQLKLHLGVQGRIAQLLTTADLLSPDKDGQGYILLRQPIQFGGTLEQFDRSQWNDLLVKAATRTPDRSKKGG